VRVIKVARFVYPVIHSATRWHELLLYFRRNLAQDIERPDARFAAPVAQPIAHLDQFDAKVGTVDSVADVLGRRRQQQGRQLLVSAIPLHHDGAYPFARHDLQSLSEAARSQTMMRSVGRWS
jgi:hypothetical protein